MAKHAKECGHLGCTAGAVLPVSGIWFCRAHYFEMRGKPKTTTQLSAALPVYKDGAVAICYTPNGKRAVYKQAAGAWWDKTGGGGHDIGALLMAWPYRVDVYPTMAAAKAANVNGGRL